LDTTSYNTFIRTVTGKRSVNTPRRSWEDNIKADLKETGWDDMDAFKWLTTLSSVNKVKNEMSNYHVLNNYPAPWSEGPFFK
jgi:hypothetical protein